MDEKTFAGVADKAVDKIAGGVEAVAKAVEKVAPHVWEVMVRQVVAEGVFAIVTGLIVAIVTWLAAKKAWASRPPEGESYDDFPRTMISIVIIVAAAGFGIYSLGQLREGAMKVANPQYYAAMMLISSVK